MIQLLIEIDESFKNYLDGYFDGKNSLLFSTTYTLLEMLYNAKQLPKGHGRLIDETKLEDIIHDKGFNSKFMNPVFTMTEVVDMMEDVPTVIEADKEEGAD